MQSEQRWISLTGICNVLKSNKNHIQWLVKNNYLEMIPGKANERLLGARFLDPTPDYAAKLRTSELIYERRHPLPSDVDVDGKAIFTKAEIAELLGMNISTLRNYLWNHKIPCIKLSGRGRAGLQLFTAKTVRQLIWTRQETRTLCKQRGPFLLKELIDYFVKAQAEADATTPTDLQFKQDDILHKKMARLLKLPLDQRETAVRDLMEKVEMAQQVVHCLKTKTPAPTD